ncbi:hypothetical protein FQA39_LY18958 [Lamprigera yunnana]|nr:hypothetical protein FQA39_LY18958 [Lamprigera yunnana]
MLNTDVANLDSQELRIRRLLGTKCKELFIGMRIMYLMPTLDCIHPYPWDMRSYILENRLRLSSLLRDLVVAETYQSTGNGEYKEHELDLINATDPQNNSMCTLHHYNEDENPVNIGGPTEMMTI